MLRAYAVASSTWVVAVATDVPGQAVEQVQRAHTQSTVADLTLWLERPDMTQRDSHRAGGADVCITRSRNSPTATMTLTFQGYYGRFADPSA